VTVASDITLWVAFYAGVLSFFSPCVLPLIPSYLTYISGLSFKQLNAEHPGTRIRLTILAHSLVFVLGFSLVFITLGALAGYASSAFQMYLREGLGWLQKIGGVLIFLFGIHLSGLFHFGMLLGEHRIHLRAKPSGFFGTLIVGIAFAAGWTPCIGPILGAILAIAASSSGGAGRGIWLLAVYSLGLGIPFLITGGLFNWFIGFFNRFKKHIRLVEICTGILLMIVGVMLFFDQFSKMSGFLYQVFPPSLG